MERYTTRRKDLRKPPITSTITSDKPNQVRTVPKEITRDVSKKKKTNKSCKLFSDCKRYQVLSATSFDLRSCLYETIASKFLDYNYLFTFLLISNVTVFLLCII